MAVIDAQLGHSDMKLTQRHYPHLSPGYVAETIRAAFGPLGITNQTWGQRAAHDPRLGGSHRGNQGRPGKVWNGTKARPNLDQEFR
jgi:hypothetical protein